MNPDRHATSHYDYFQDLIKGDLSSAESHRKFYDEYNAVLDMDADYYLETIQTVFQDFKLVNGTWDVRSISGKIERVRPQDITGCKLLTVEGELDDISGSGQTRAALELCSGIGAADKRHYEVKGAGHYGIFSGKRWRDMVYPQVQSFIAQASVLQSNLEQKRPVAGKKSTQVAIKSGVTKKPVAAKPASKSAPLKRPARKASRAT
jgi:poly(3-hydroxybutyrate) depolymerase